MNTKLSIVFGLLYMVSVTATADVPDANAMVLPDTYVVYTNGTTVINHPEAGFEEKQ